MATRLPNSLPESNAGQESLVIDQDEAGGPGRVTVRITRFGARLLDADNLAGGIKPILDAMRYEGLIPDDNPGAIRLEVRQEKAKKDRRGTLIEVISTVDK